MEKYTIDDLLKDYNKYLYSETATKNFNIVIFKFDNSKGLKLIIPKDFENNEITTNAVLTKLIFETDYYYKEVSADTYRRNALDIRSYINNLKGGN